LGAAPDTAGSKRSNILWFLGLLSEWRLVLTTARLGSRFPLGRLLNQGTHDLMAPRGRTAF